MFTTFPVPSLPLWTGFPVENGMYLYRIICLEGGRTGAKRTRWANVSRTVCRRTYGEWTEREETCDPREASGVPKAGKQGGTRRSHLDLPLHRDAKKDAKVQDQDRPEHRDVKCLEKRRRKGEHRGALGREPEFELWEPADKRLELLAVLCRQALLISVLCIRAGVVGGGGGGGGGFRSGTWGCRYRPLEHTMNELNQLVGTAKYGSSSGSILSRKDLDHTMGEGRGQGGSSSGLCRMGLRFATHRPRARPGPGRSWVRGTQSRD